MLLFFWDVLIGPRVLLPADVLYRIPPWSGLPEAAAHPVPHNSLIADAILQNVAWKSFARAAFARGELPLWNPYEYAGLPFLAGGQSGSLYPLGALFYLLPVERAYGPFLALHVFMAGAFAYAFARVLGCRPAAALLGGVGFAFSAFLIVSFTWPMIVSAASWLPLLLLTVELIVRQWERGAPPEPERAVGLALLGALALALQILAGHLEITFYAAFTLLFYGLGRLILGPLRERGPGPALGALACLALMGLAGPLVAAVQLLPFHELIGQNYRRGLVDYATVIGYALPPTQVATFLLPDFYGNPSHHDYLSLLTRSWRPAPDFTDPPRTIWWGFPKNYVEAASYVGVLPLLLAPLGALLTRTRQALLLALLALLALSLAFGSPLYGLFFFGVPGIDQLHTPFRWIYPYTLAVTTLAALGAEATLRLERTRRWAARLGLLVGALGALGLAALAAVALRPNRLAVLAESALVGSSRLGRAFADGDMLLSYEWRNALLLALALLLAGTALWLLVRPERTRLGATLAVAALALDLFLVHYGFNTRADPAPLHAALPAVELLGREREPFRVVGLVEGDPLSPIAAMRLGIEDVRGYDTVIPRRYVEYWSLIEPPQGLPYSKLQGISRPESLASPLLRLLNVTYVLSARPIQSPELEPAQAGAMYVYRLRDPIPRAFLVGRARHADGDAEALALLASPDFDPRREVVLTGAPARPLGGGFAAGTVAWLERAPSRLRLEVETDGPAYLVVADFHFPGWLATVDGAATPVLLANHAFRAVALPAGRHAVELRYAPDTVKLGAALSGLAGLGVLLGLAACLWRLASRPARSAGPLRRIAGNALSGMGAQLVNKAIDFAFAVVMLRLLGPEGLGRYAWAIAITGYLEIVSNFGLNALVIREGSAAPERLGRLGGGSLLVRLGIWASGLPLIALVVLGWRGALGLADESAIAAALLCLALLPGNVAATYSALFYARERIEVPAALTVATTLLKVSLGLAALLAGYGIVGLAAVALVGNVLTALALGALAGRLRIAPPLQLDRGEARAMLAPAFPLMLNHLLATLFFRIDVLLLQALRSDLELGYYATAYKFVDGIGIVPSAFTFAIFPLLSRLAAAQPDALRRAYAMSLKLLVFLSVPIALLVTALAHPLVLLVGGRAYLPDAAVALQLLIWFLPLSFANGLTQYALVAAGHQRAIVGAFALAVVFNVAANVVAIPALGYRGAALVTVLSEVALAVPFGAVVARRVGLSLWRALWPFLTGGAVGLTIFLVLEPTAGGALALAASLAAYGAVLAALRPIDSHERAQLRVLGERLGAPLHL
ncbi:MAG TPA: oligosaccharide flippase family protein [Chloroflexota bacterium]|nr:oligosaccharide flippase family protein [Chloroflexota bacterium]